MTFDAELEETLARYEIALDAERNRVEALLRECAATKAQPSKDYWHKLHRLTHQVNTMRRLLETNS